MKSLPRLICNRCGYTWNRWLTIDQLIYLSCGSCGGDHPIEIILFSETSTTTLFKVDDDSKISWEDEHNIEEIDNAISIIDELLNER